MIGADKASVLNWERNRREPSLRHMPGIVRFLGYAPYDPAWSYGERLTAARRALGVSRAQLAKLVGVDESTVYRWEHGQRRPQRQFKEKLKAVLADVDREAG